MESIMSDLIPLFRPKSVALIGASSDTKKYGYWTAKSLIDNKFQGEIHLISRSGGEILGQPTYPDILSVPGEVDLAIIAIAPKHILPIIEQCVEKGVKTGIVVSTGLAKRVPKARKSNAVCWRSPARATCASWAPTAWGCTVRRSA